MPLRVVQRAQIILMAAEGMQSQAIAQALRVSRPRCNSGASGFWRFAWRVWRRMRRVPDGFPEFRTPRFEPS